MVAKRKAGEMNSNIYFNTEKTVGVLIQHQFCRAIFFINGINKDEYYWYGETKPSELDKWVESKRNAYKEQEAQATAPQV